MSIEVAVRVNDRGELQIPEEIQRQLFPGMVVVLKLDEQKPMKNGDNEHFLADETSEEAQFVPEGPRIIYKNGLPVIRGEVAADFDWDEFMQEGREAPMHPFEPLNNEIAV